MAQRKGRRPSIEALLAQGGERRIGILQYAVMAAMMEPVFLFLANEYRMRPGHQAALALYDVFCAPNAPARICVPSALPPRNLQLSVALERIRMQCRQQTAWAQNEATAIAPQRYLFDFVVQTLSKDSRGRIAQLRRRYDPSRSPAENLRGGKMTPGQKEFAERVWKPVVRPRLVAAGFWRIGTIE